MGAIIMSVSEYISSVSEFVGNKTGLCLDENDLARLTKDFSEVDSNRFMASKESVIRVRSEDYSAIILWLYYKTGYTDKYYPENYHLELYKKYHKDKTKMDVCVGIMDFFIETCRRLVEEEQCEDGQLLDPSPIVEFAGERYGELGYSMSLEIIKAFSVEMELSPWKKVHRIIWKDRRKLEELFQSESLETEYGRYFDQRFVHYLINNFHDIGNIHWRQFEAIAGEYFTKLGCHVEIGSGRNDGGVDLRVWDESQDIRGPAAILVQCKRQKKKIEKVIVKSLWADMCNENAQSGLIVTSSSISPGAEEVCRARGYNIKGIDRKALQKWLLAMREPGVGVFMGE